MSLKEKIMNSLEGVEGRVKTKTIRDITKPYKKELRNLPIEDSLAICESLLERREWVSTILSYQIAFDVRKNYNKDTFRIFEQWMHRYITDWWDCDDFCTHAFMDVLLKYPDNLSKINNWTTSKNFAVRRCAPVILIVPIRKGFIGVDKVFEISDILMNDEHYLVQKGYGWLLKEATKHHKEEVITYLKKNVRRMPRTAFRYAIEKLDKELKKELMALS